nr:unnamed protein product [Spirometra erinaceieuropaei]
MEKPLVWHSVERFLEVDEGYVDRVPLVKRSGPAPERLQQFVGLFSAASFPTELPDEDSVKECKKEGLEEQLSTPEAQLGEASRALQLKSVELSAASGKVDENEVLEAESANLTAILFHLREELEGSPTNVEAASKRLKNFVAEKTALRLYRQSVFPGRIHTVAASRPTPREQSHAPRAFGSPHVLPLASPGSNVLNLLTVMQEAC